MLRYLQDNEAIKAAVTKTQYQYARIKRKVTSVIVFVCVLFIATSVALNLCCCLGSLFTTKPLGHLAE